MGSNPENPYFSVHTKNEIIFFTLFHGAASLEGSVSKAIVNLWLYFYHSVEGVAYIIISLKSNN